MATWVQSMDAQKKEAEVDKPYRESQINFTPILGANDSMQNPETAGILSGSGKEARENTCKGTIVGAKHAHDIKVKTETDKNACQITGLVLLPDGRLVLTDYYGNCKIKAVNVQSGQALTEMTLSSHPWDVAAINNNTVAVTLPLEKKLAFVTVGDNNLSIERTLAVNGTCYGVDYRNGKLAVSFFYPNIVQVFNLRGRIHYTIEADKQGKLLFNNPHYLTYGQDETTLYVSNYRNNNVVCVKMDGTVVATYTDSGLRGPMKPVIDNPGNVYVCTQDSHQVHQISKDCKKIQVLLTRADGLLSPRSICLSEAEDKLYVGMYSNDNVKVYKTESRPQ